MWTSGTYRIVRRDLDFFFPPEHNSSKCLFKMLRKFDDNHMLSEYKFDRIIRIKYKSLQIDLLPKMDGIDSQVAIRNSIQTKFNNQNIDYLALEELKRNIRTVKNYIENDQT